MDGSANYVITVEILPGFGRSFSATIGSENGSYSNSEFSFGMSGAELSAAATNGIVQLDINSSPLDPNGLYSGSVGLKKISVIQFIENTNVPIAMRDGETYFYGHNGMLRDDEIAGSGNSYDTKFRGYDSRLGRWKSTDPIVHSMFSPYSSFDNNPVFYIDPSGTDAEGGGFGSTLEKKGFKTATYSTLEGNGSNGDWSSDIINIDDIYVKKDGSFSVVETDNPDRYFFEDNDGAWWYANGYAGEDGSWKTSLGEKNAADKYHNYQAFFQGEFGDKLLNDNFFKVQMNVFRGRDLQSSLFAARVSEAIGKYGTQTVATIGLVTDGIIAGGEVLGVAAYHQIGISLWRYKKSSGYGINLMKEGRRVLGLDWHRFRIGGKSLGRDINRPHIDVPGRGVKHWPWHQLNKWNRGVK